MNRDLRRLIEEARGRGWKVARTTGDHMRLTHPNGSLVICPTTPGDRWRGLKNLKADLKRAERAGR